MIEGYILLDCSVGHYFVNPKFVEKFWDGKKKILSYHYGVMFMNTAGNIASLPLNEVKHQQNLK
jgi:hypothetical protein